MHDAEFERLVRRHGSAVHSFLLYRTGDPELAEEALADCFERAYRARESFDPRRASAKTWLCTIALNRARDLARRAESERIALGRLAEQEVHRTDAATDLTTRLDERTALLRALAELPSEEREAIALTYGADLTARGAARALGVPATTVQGRLYRGLRRLRSLLGDVVPDGGR